MKQIKGKALKEGMNVIVTRSPKKCSLAAMSGVPLTVKAVEYPFAVFESEQEHHVYGVSLMTFASISPTPRESKRVKHTTTANVKKCRFRQVSDKYVNAIRKSPTASDDDFSDTL